MVYSGRPSKSCEACRRVKTKCDAKKPSCNQCLRLGRKCPGYRDITALLFRDETDKVVQKTKNGIHARKAVSRTATPTGCHVVGPSSPSSSSSSSSSSSYSCSPPFSPPLLDLVPWPSPSITISLFPTLRDQAIGVFLFQYGQGMSTCFDYLPDLYEQQGSVGSTLFQDALECLGLAYLSASTSDSKQLRLQAEKKQGEVISSVNRALQNKTTATSDHMLASVMMLGLFETIIGLNPITLRSWANHIYGATAITISRGPEQFRSKLGRKMFTHLRLLTVLYALQHRDGVPSDIIELSKSFTPQNSSEAKSCSIFNIFVLLAAIRSHEAGSTRASPAEAANITAAAQRVDAAFAQWAADNPQVASTAANDNDNEAALGDVAGHLDPLHDVGSTGFYMSSSSSFSAPSSTLELNMCRAGRLIANEVILRQLGVVTTTAAAAAAARDHHHYHHDAAGADAEPSSVEQEIISRRQLQSALCEEICASVPAAAAGEGLGPGSSSMKGVVGNSLIWPLYAVATTTNVSVHTRMWVIQCLREIAARASLQRGMALSEVLLKKWEITGWASVRWNTTETIGDEGIAGL